MQYTLNFSESEFRNYQIMKDAYKNGKILSVSSGGGHCDWVSVLSPDDFQKRLLDEIVKLNIQIKELTDRNWDLQVITSDMVDKSKQADKPKKRRWFL